MNCILKIIFFIGFILVSPIIILALIVIWVEDGSPAIFVQERLGQNKKNFNLYKLRTMYKNTPNLGTHEIENIHHLKAGSVLRKYKIDELPQLINYFKNELALIGPRPGLPNQLELKHYRDKFNVFKSKPGITGLSQVLGYDMSNPKLLSLVDALYIKEKTFKLDIMIFCANFLGAFKKRLNIKFHDRINKIKKELQNV